MTDHSALYTPRGSEVYGSDPADPPDRHDAWIRTQGVDFAAIPAVSTLHWLRGTVKADEVDESRFTVRLDREKSILSSSAEDRPGVVESWGQVPELSSVTGTVLLADSNVKRVELTLSPQHKLSIDYEQTVHQTVIPLPEEFEPIELTTLLHGLGVSVRSQRPDPPSV